MKYTLKYSILVIAKKLKVEVRVSITDQNLFVRRFTNETADTTTFSSLPSLVISILRPRMEGEMTKEWNPNDTLMLTKYTLPIFYRELTAIYEGMKTPNLYSYTDNRLELNESAAEEVRRVFQIYNTTVELAPMVITQEKPDGVDYLEGIKMKFNNENSSVHLTLNDAYSLMWNINNVDVDVISLEMFNYYLSTGSKEMAMNLSYKSDIDIKPKKMNDF